MLKLILRKMLARPFVTVALVVGAIFSVSDTVQVEELAVFPRL